MIETQGLKFEEKTYDGLTKDSMRCRASKFEMIVIKFIILCGRLNA